MSEDTEECSGRLFRDWGPRQSCLQQTLSGANEACTMLVSCSPLVHQDHHVSGTLWLVQRSFAGCIQWMHNQQAITHMHSQQALAQKAMPPSAHIDVQPVLADSNHLPLCSVAAALGKGLAVDARVCHQHLIHLSVLQQAMSLVSHVRLGTQALL